MDSAFPHSFTKRWNRVFDNYRFDGNGNGQCVAAATGEVLESDLLRLNGEFGQACKMVGNELFVGEPGAVGSLFVVGEVHYFTRVTSSSPWIRQGGFFSNSEQNGAQFGSDIDYDGARVIVGEPNVTTSADIFTFSGGTETFEQQITGNTYSGRFGRAVAIDGSHALIGAPSETLTVANQGGVEYWSESGGTWTFQQAFTIGVTPTAGNYFGQGITMVDDSTAYIVYCDTANLSTVTVQLWTRSGTTWSYQSEWSLAGFVNPATNFVGIDNDGTSLILGQGGYDVTTSSDEGFVLVTTQGGDIRTEIIGAVGEEIGTAVSINGGEAAIGKAFSDPSSIANAGTVEIWDVCP